MFHVKQNEMANSGSAPQQCFACDETLFQNHLLVKDYFLSKEDFQLIRCRNCGLLYTFPAPDPEIISAYYDSKEYTSHNTEKRSFKNVLYRLARRRALDLKLKMIHKHVRPGTLLDIGAGTGDFLNHCRNKGWSATGIEPNNLARERAMAEFGLEILEPQSMAAIPPASMDVITMWHVLEHLHDPAEQVKTNMKLLKTDGLLVLALPNYESWDANYYGKFWAAYDVPRHLHHFTQKSVMCLAEKSGLKIVEVQPLKFDAYYISLLSEKYANGKMNFLKAFFNGWRSNLSAKNNNFGYSSWVYLLKRK